MANNSAHHNFPHRGRIYPESSGGNKELDVQQKLKTVETPNTNSGARKKKCLISGIVVFLFTVIIIVTYLLVYLTLDTKNATMDVQSTLTEQRSSLRGRGKRFLVLFMLAYNSGTKGIYITSDNGVRVNITTSGNLDPNLKTEIDRMVDIPSSKLITLPPAMVLNNFQREPKAILLETSDDAFIISLTDGQTTVGSTAHIPLHRLSTKYVVVSTNPLYRSQFAVAAIENNTKITIKFKIKRYYALYIDGSLYFNNDVFNISLDRFETYQIANHMELTGTVIESSYPIAAFSGNYCNWIGPFGGCDFLIEQLPPTESVDKIYVVPPNADDRDTLIRIIALENSNITFNVNASNRTVFLTQYDTFDFMITNNQTCFIESKESVLVTIFGLQSKSSEMGNPSMTIVPGVNQYLNYYKVTIPAGFVNNYVSIMIRYSSKDLLRINGTVIQTEDVVFEDVLDSDFSYSVRVIRVTEGELTAFTDDGERFGMICSGVSQQKAYGLSANSLLLNET